MPLPRPQLTSVTRLTSMPSRRAPSGPSETARMATPKGRVRKYQPSPTAMATVTPSTVSWLHE